MYTIENGHGSSAVGQQVCKRKVGCSNPSSDRSKSLKQVVTAPLQNAQHEVGVSYTDGSSEMTIIKGCPLSQQVWHVKEPSLLNGHKCQTQVKICSPSPAKMSVTFSSGMKNSKNNSKIQTSMATKFTCTFACIYMVSCQL